MCQGPSQLKLPPGFHTLKITKKGFIDNSFVKARRWARDTSTLYLRPVWGPASPLASTPAQMTKDLPKGSAATRELATLLLGFIADHEWSPNDDITNTFVVRPEELHMLLVVANHVNPSN